MFWLTLHIWIRTTRHRVYSSSTRPARRRCSPPQFRFQIPEHTHKGPGLRYVLEGAIAITWKGGSTETFKAGSTYFEASGSNHPIGQMSGRNAADGRTRVLIFEVDPKE